MMMLYSIKDTIANEFGFPFDAKNDDVAIRKFNGFVKQVVNTPSSAIDPNEFKLYFIGTYDVEKGIIQGSEPVEVDLLKVGEKADE